MSLERVEVRLVDCGNLRLRQHRRSREEAVESGSATATDLVEKVAGQTRLRTSERHDA